jgi:hypothetical protein
MPAAAATRNPIRPSSKTAVVFESFLEVTLVDDMLISSLCMLALAKMARCRGGGGLCNSQVRKLRVAEDFYKES